MSSFVISTSVILTAPFISVLVLTVSRNVHKIEKSDCWVYHVCPSAWNNWAPLDGFS